MKGEGARRKALEPFLQALTRKDTFHHTAIVNDEQRTTTASKPAKAGGTSNSD